MTSPDNAAPSKTRSRLQLLLVAAFFLGSFGIAAGLLTKLTGARRFERLD